MVQPSSIEAIETNVVHHHLHWRTPHYQCTTLFDLIASIQARYSTDAAGADAVVLRLLREQRVTFYHATVGREVAAMREDC
jgi:hypothetical protein